MEILVATEEAKKVFSNCSFAFKEKNVKCEFVKTFERKTQDKKY